MRARIEVLWVVYSNGNTCDVCGRAYAGLYKLNTLGPTPKFIARICGFCHEKVKEVPDHIPEEQHCEYVKILIERLKRKKKKEKKEKPSNSMVECLSVKEEVTGSSPV